MNETTQNLIDIAERIGIDKAIETLERVHGLSMSNGSQFRILKVGDYITRDTESLRNGRWTTVSYGMIGHQVWGGEEGQFRSPSFTSENTESRNAESNNQ